MIITLDTETGKATERDANLGSDGAPWGLTTGKENDGILYYLLSTAGGQSSNLISKHVISTKVDSTVDATGPRGPGTGDLGFEQAGGSWYFWQRGHDDLAMQRVGVDPATPGDVTTENMDTHANLEAVASFPPLEDGIIIFSSLNETSISEDSSNTRSLDVTIGQLPGWLFDNGVPGKVSTPIAVPYPSGSTDVIEFVLKEASGRRIRNPRDAAWLTDKTVEFRISLRDTPGSEARYLQTYDSSPQRFSITSDGGSKISVPNTDDWPTFFDVDTRKDFRGTILMHLVEACGVPARNYEVDNLIQRWDIEGAYECGNRAVAFTSAAHTGLTFDSYLAAGFDIKEDYANSYILNVQADTEAVVIADQTVGTTVTGIYAYASSIKRESVVFLPKGDYLLLLKGDEDGEYAASLRFAGPAGKNIFGNPPDNFTARADPGSDDKVVIAQWDEVEDAESYFLCVTIGERTYLIDTGGATAARVPVDPSIQEASVSVFGWSMVIGGVAFTLDSFVRPVRWETSPEFTADIPTPTPNPGAGLISGFASTLMEEIGMESYTTEDDEGNPITVDAPRERGDMAVVMLVGFGALIVSAGLFLVTYGNVMIDTVAGVGVWSGLGPIFFELHPAVAYGPLILILFFGLMAAVKKLG